MLGPQGLRELGVHALVLRQLALDFLETLEVRGSEATVLRFPLLVRRGADAVLAARILDRHSGLGLVQDRDDLALGESRFLHGRLLSGWHGRNLYFCPV